MKLLLDEMHAPAIAATLTEAGWYIVAVAAQAERRGMSDEDLLAQAAREHRLLVTENIADFASLANQWALEGRTDAGLIFTNPRRFNRADLAYPGNLLAALRTLLEHPPELGRAAIWWL